MTVAKIKEMYKNEFVDVEVFEPVSRGQHYPTQFHTDNCNGTDEYTESSEVGLFELMDENDYNNTIYANCSVKADFDEWFDDKNAKVLCLMLK